MNVSTMHRQLGFTLIELLISIVILSLISVASYSALVNHIKDTKQYEKSANRLTQLQQFSLLIDRDFAQLVQKDAVLSNNSIEFLSIQDDKILKIKYEFNDEITRTSQYLGEDQEYSQKLMEDIEKPSVKLLGSASNNLVSSWSNKSSGYLKAAQIKFTHKRYGEITKLALITE